MRWIRRSVPQAGETERRSPAELSRAAADVVMLSRFYYLFLAFNIGTSGLQFARAYMGRPPTAPLWPIDAVQWLIGSGWFAYDRVVTVVGLLFAIAAASFPGLCCGASAASRTCWCTCRLPLTGFRYLGPCGRCRLWAYRSAS